MPHDPDYSSYISLCLSEILYDIGLNEEMVLKERRAWLLRESLTTLTHRLKGYQRTIYMFGSMTEGSTTLALKSDNDNLICDYSLNVVTDLKDCKPGEVNYVMSHDVSTPPGYCLLRQVLGHDPFLIQERIALKHVTSQTFSWNSNDDDEYELHGPAIHVKGQFGYNEQDYVIALHCKTGPRSAKAWLTEEGIGRWPTKEMKSFAKQNGCFLVGVGSKGGEMEQFEWRVSMSQAERCLMFSLNKTQIRCYVLMKMLLKTFIHPDGNSVISSYMCKTVLFHCITHSYLGFWQESKLLYCLTLCLSALQYCILIGNCPHFIIHENNLMEGRITTKFRTMFIEQMRRIILDTELSLRNVVYDNLGLRLQCKMKMYSRKTRQLLAPSEKLRAFASGILLRNTGKYIQNFHKMVICVVRYEDLNVALQYIRQCICKLIKFHRVGSSLERIACKFLALELSSTLGSLTASSNILSSSFISSEALKWFDASLDSDVSSSRLKKASAFYSAGDMETTYSIIEDVQERYDLKAVEPVCRCTILPSHPARDGFNTAAYRLNEEGFKHVAAYCVTFLRCELQCIPKELQYEMYRTTAAEQSRRHANNRWLDLAIIDSLTYLLFLKYKTCGRLGKHIEQKQALKDLMRAIYMEPNLGHRETALNLVGQLMEEEGKLSNALRCFMVSHDIQPEHNAAKLHICKVLAKMINRKTCKPCMSSDVVIPDHM